MGIRDHGVFQFEVTGIWISDQTARQEYERTVMVTTVAPSPEVAEAHLRNQTKKQSWAHPPMIALTGTEKIDCMLLEPVW